MSRKRLRSAGGGEEWDEPSSKRTRKVNLKIPKELDSRVRLIAELFNALNSYEDSDHGVLFQLFFTAPSEKLYPAYGDVISTPMDFRKVQQKFEAGEYPTMSMLLADVLLIVENTRQFFHPDSANHRQADALETAGSQLLQRVLVSASQLHESDSEDSDFSPSPTELTLSIPTSRLPSLSKRQSLSSPNMSSDQFSSSVTSSNPRSGSAPERKVPPLKINLASIREGDSKVTTPTKGGVNAARSLTSGGSKTTVQLPEVAEFPAWVGEYLSSDDPIKKYAAAVFSHCDSLGDCVAEPFHLLPSREQYPDYYRIITQPVDLYTIQRNVEEGRYFNLKTIQDDMIVMIRNAQYFNEPSSDIYRNAGILRKFIINRCSELERKYRTTALSSVTSPTLQGMGPDEGGGGVKMDDEKKKPKTKSGNGGQKESVMRSSMSSVSETEEEEEEKEEEEEEEEEEEMGGASESSGEDNSSNDDEERVEESEGSGVVRGSSKTKRKLILHIKKEKGSTKKRDKDQEDPIARLLKTKKSPVLKKKFLAVYKSIVLKQDEDGRVLSELFMRRPSAKHYPEYYIVIKEPIDLREILVRIRNGGFSSLEELGKAVELMVENALTFNEEGSQVYSDALVLREVAQAAIGKIKEAWPDPAAKSSDTPTHVGRGRPRKVVAPPPAPARVNHVVALFFTVKEHVGPKGKKPAVVFYEVPTTADYQAVVKKPMDIKTIQSKFEGGGYQTVDLLVEDFALVTDNAFSYYARDSEHSQLALALHRVVMKKYTELKKTCQVAREDVAKSVQKILCQLVSSLMQSEGAEEGLKDVEVSRKVRVQDEEPLKEDGESPKSGDIGSGCGSSRWTDHTFKIDHVKMWVEAGDYLRLDVLQRDICDLLCRASQMGRSIVALELARKYMAARQDLCGEVKGRLWSPGLAYGLNELLKDLDEAANQTSQTSQTGPSSQTPPLGSPVLSDSESRLTSPMEVETAVGGVAGREEWEEPGKWIRDECDSCEWKGEEFHVGEVVYVSGGGDGGGKGGKPRIVLLEKFWSDTSNVMCFRGQWFYRPEETFHVATKLFYDKEVFRSDFHGVGRMSQVVGRASVLHYKDYSRMVPMNMAEEDVYVCVSKYSCKAKSFKKIKVKQWVWPGSSPTLVARERPVELTKVPSVFATPKSSMSAVETTPRKGGAGGTKAKAGGEEEEEESEEVAFVGPVLDNVLLEVGNNNARYYDQFCIDDNSFRIGDFVYLRSDQDLPFIARIDRMWTDSNGDPWIHGPWFLRPNEVDHVPTRTFYQQELLLSNIQDTNPMRSISGRCLVLGFADYCSKRPTGHSEEDVYICQSKYNEVDKEIRKLKGWRVFQHSPSTSKDEVYYFIEEVQPIKKASPKLFVKEPSPQTTMSMSAPLKTAPVPTPTTSATSTPSQLTISGGPILSLGGGGGGLGGGAGAKQKSFTIPSKVIQQLLASATKLNTTQPTQTPAPIVQGLQVSAAATPTSSTTQLAQAIVNSGMAAKLLASTQPTSSTSSSTTTAIATKSRRTSEPQSHKQPVPILIQPHVPVQPQGGQQTFPCYWEDCTKTFRGPLELYHHVVGPGLSHLSTEVEGAYFCRWRNCPRNPKTTAGRSFDSQNKIVRHMKEVHLMKLSALFGIGVRAGGIPRIVPPSPIPTTSTAQTSITLKVPPRATPPLVRATVPQGPVATPSVRVETTPPPIDSLPIATELKSKAQPKPTTQMGQIFVPPPANRNTLVHSDIYLRYIQGLRCNSSSLSSSADSSILRSSGHLASVPAAKAEDWFSARALDMVATKGSDATPLPQKEKDKAVTDALWALRDYMNRDSLRLSRYMDS